MTYAVEYSVDGGPLTKLVDGIPLEDTARHTAKRSLTVNKAHFARVINEDSGGEVWSVSLADDGSFLESDG